MMTHNLGRFVPGKCHSGCFKGLQALARGHLWLSQRPLAKSKTGSNLKGKKRTVCTRIVISCIVISRTRRRNGCQRVDKTTSTGTKTLTSASATVTQ
eukprot:338901-Rhodomonas_salina.1